MMVVVSSRECGCGRVTCSVEEVGKEGRVDGRSFELKKNELGMDCGVGEVGKKGRIRRRFAELKKNE